jgi:hypothetical protein
MIAIRIDGPKVLCCRAILRSVHDPHRTAASKFEKAFAVISIENNKNAISFRHNPDLSLRHNWRFPTIVIAIEAPR